MTSFAILGSGSCGNSYVFSCNGKSILIDSGYSLRQIKNRMEKTGFDYNSVIALFLTHLHPDHACSAGTFSRQLSKPVYVSKDSFKYANVEYSKLNIPEELQCFIEIDQTLILEPFSITCFKTYHDSAGSVGYSIEVENKCFVIITDTGFYDQKMLELAKKADILFLESNYDEKMLEEGKYPIWLKNRVSGERGHLSNNQAKALLEASGFDKTKKKVYLVHISENNNSYDSILNTMKSLFNYDICMRGLTYGPSYNSDKGTKNEFDSQLVLFD